MMERVREEKELFERGLARYTALRNVFTQQTNELFDHIGLEALRANAAQHAPADRGQPVHARRARRDERLLPPDPRRLRRGGAGSRPRSTT